MIDDDKGRALARHARKAIVAALGGGRSDPPSGAWAEVPSATFVTIRRGAELHGCMGSLDPRRPLALDVAHNAVAAALFDPRATPLSLDEVPRLGIEVTLLGPLERVPCADEATAVAALRPGIDGVVLEWRGRRGTFLPQVWESVEDPAEFLAHLKTKAGLDEDFWADDVAIYRYTTRKWVDVPPHDVGDESTAPS